MDYIREELLRQRAALARLLLGGETEQEEEPAESSEEGMEAVWPAGEEVFRNSRKMAAMEKIQPLWDAGRSAGAESWGAYGGFYEEASEMAVRRETGFGEARRPHRFTVAEINGGRAARLTGQSEDIFPEERLSVETVTAPFGEAEGAKEVSRIFQRDARRYDGGFTLY